MHLPDVLAFRPSEVGSKLGWRISTAWRGRPGRRTKAAPSLSAGCPMGSYVEWVLLFFWGECVPSWGNGIRVDMVSRQ